MPVPGSSTADRSVVPIRILVVEDHADTAQMMRRILQKDGHTVELATTLAEANRCCAERSYDLIITDIELPDGVAYDLIQGGRACHGTRAIVVSGHGLPAHIDRSQQAGFREHLIKPFSITQLREAIARATEDAGEKKDEGRD